MTISTETIKNTWEGNGVTTSFAYEFRIFAKGDLSVIKTDTDGVDTELVLDTDYTVLGAGDESGSITYPISGDELATGEYLTLHSEIDYTQDIDLVNGAAPFQETHERAFDYMTRLIQQLKEALDRSVKVSITDDTDPDDLIASIQTSEINSAASASAAAQSAVDAQEVVDNVSARIYQETASVSQTVINTSFSFDVSGGNVVVFIAGAKLAINTYTLTDSTTITLDDPLIGGEAIEVYSILFESAPSTPLYAINNLSDVDDADDTLDNLGGTTVGKQVFTATDAAEARDVIGATPGKNLLDNPDFSVNQDELDATGAAYSNGEHPIDRWALAETGTNPNISLSADQSIIITMSATESLTVSLDQMLENFADYAGKQITFARDVKTDATGVVLQIEDGVGSTASTAHTGGGASETLTVTHIVDASPTKLRIRQGLVSSSAVTSGEYIEIEKDGKLELGSYSTTIEPTKYAEELRNCRFYYKLIRGRGLNGWSYTTTTAWLMTIIEAMHSIPAVTLLLSTPTIRENGASFQATGSTINSTGCERDLVMFRITGFTGLTSQNLIMGNSGSHVIALDANIPLS